MPRPFIHPACMPASQMVSRQLWVCSSLTRVRRVENRDDAGNQVRRAGEHKRDSLVETKSSDGRREEIFKTVGSEVHLID